MNIKNKLKATISNLMVAFLFVIIFYVSIYFTIGDKINMAISLINKFAIENSNQSNEVEKIEIKENNKLKEYPEYGAKIGKIEIESINTSVDLYYGNTLEIVKNGIGLASSGYFPGEGGSIICMGHNFKTMLKNLPKTQNGDIIKITTDYGEYNYKIYDKKIIEETDFESLPVQENEEILMLYTCYPINNIGHASQRYVVYAKLEK